MGPATGVDEGEHGGIAGDESGQRKPKNRIFPVARHPGQTEGEEEEPGLDAPMGGVAAEDVAVTKAVPGEFGFAPDGARVEQGVAAEGGAVGLYVVDDERVGAESHGECPDRQGLGVENVAGGDEGAGGESDQDPQEGDLVPKAESEQESGGGRPPERAGLGVTDGGGDAGDGE